eukprot:g24035.t1
MARDLQRVDDLNFGTLVEAAGTGALGVAKRRPVTVSLWALGLLLAAFAKGFAVDDVTAETFSLGLRPYHSLF